MIFTERTPRVVAAGKLQRPAARRKAGRFLVEGSNAVTAALESAAEVFEIFVSEAGELRYPAILAAADARGFAVSPVSDRGMAALTDTVTAPGIVAVCAVLADSVQLPVDAQLVAVPVDIAEPGNAGTLIRTADAIGADAVILAGDAVDPHNGKCVRASAGSVFHLPLVRDRDPGALVHRLRAAGLQVLATAADGEVSLDDVGELLAAPTAWLFGNEARGLSDDLLAAADHRVRIPIRGRAESFNVTTAASICLYESAPRVGTQNQWKYLIDYAFMANETRIST